MSRPEPLPQRTGANLFRLLLPLLLVLAGNAWAEEPHWIDVRSESEYAEAHLPSAVNIPYTDIVSRIDEVTTDKDARIYLYCRSGRRSGIALQALEQAGFTNVVNAGGLEEARQTAARLKSCSQEPSADC